jgi:hypothetical protein
MTAKKLLAESVEKLITLSNHKAWPQELLDKAPPVLWFGDAETKKPKFLTLGANPSGLEFLASQEPDPITHKHVYLLAHRRRLFHLSQEQGYLDLLDGAVQDKVIRSYNEYFRTGNSYRWFGSNKDDSYNAEGVLRALNASYFEGSFRMQGIHIDLFPFATISDFSQIQEDVERDLFSSGWATALINALLEILQPRAVLVVGRNNADWFCRLTRAQRSSLEPYIFKSADGRRHSCEVWRCKYKHYNIAGVSRNLGNPRGLTHEMLHELGQWLVARWRI